MDFRRIEWIFLVVFIALDIFLGMSAMQGQRVYTTASPTGSGNQIAQNIKADNIVVPKLSDDSDKGAYVASSGNNILSTRYAKVAKSGDQSVTVNTTDYEMLDAQLNQALHLRKDDVAKQVTDFVHNESNVLYGKSYVYQAHMSSGTRFVFAEKVDGRLILDDRGKVIVTVRANVIVSYTQTYIDAVSTMRSNQSLISEREAVYALYRSNELVENSKVIWTELGYTRLLDAKGSTVYIPAWNVGVESKNSKNVTEKKVNAITKAVIKTTH